MEIWNVVFPVVTLLLGAAASHLVEVRRYERARSDQLADALRSQRAEAYRLFISDAHMTAHLIGRTSPGSEVPFATTVEKSDVYARLDSDVSKDLYQMEVFAQDATLKAARDVRGSLIEFRTAIMYGGAHYMDDGYKLVLSRYQKARSNFIQAAREEVLDALSSRARP